LPASFEVILVGRWLVPQTLRVLGSDSNVDLGNVQVVTAGDEIGDWYSHPGNGDKVKVVMARAASPVQLPALDVADLLGAAETTYWGHSPGYAWAKTRVSHVRQDDNKVWLDPGGGLEITLHGPRLPKNVLVRIRSQPEVPERPKGVPDDLWNEFVEGRKERGTPIAELVPHPGVIKAHGLGPGSYVVQVEQGGSFVTSLVLGKVATRVVAGQTHQVAVVVAPATKAPPRVPVSGTLRIPAAWKCRAANLEFQAVGKTEVWVKEEKHVALRDMHPLPGGELYRWSGGELIHGQYQLTIHPFRIRLLLNTGPHGTTDLHPDVPPPAPVSVRFTDAETGAPVHPEYLHWMMWFVELGGSYSPARVEPGKAGKLFRFQAPIGRIELSTHAEGYESVHVVRDVRANGNEFTVPLRRAQGIVIRLLDGKSEADSEWQRNVTIEEIDGDGHWCWNRGNRNGVTKFGVTKSGQYRVKIKRIPGFEPIPDHEVTVHSGKMTTLDILLRRRR
jgi:hypothetical protein